MYKSVLESISGVDIYPIVSLVIFFLFFTGVIIWVFKADKSYINKMGSLPLEIRSCDEHTNAEGIIK
jgi:cytochrome c oxidase cbb3-type subunit IV